MADLITTARARYNLDNLSTTAEEDTTIAALVTACSRAIRTFCRRQFDSQQFDELYSRTGQPRLLLRQFPIQSVERVAYDPVPVLRIVNSSAANQRASVAVTASGLTLVHVVAGVADSETIAWSDEATLAEVAAAVTALGNGWQAELVDDNLALWPSADLHVQGAYSARDQPAPLRMHTQELADFDIDAAAGMLHFPGFPCELWPFGPGYWRVVYTAGFSTVPEDVQEACAQWVASLFWKCKRDPGLASESIPNAVARAVFPHLPPEVKALLEPYKDRRITRI